MVADRIGNRFKEYYENRSKTYLMRRSNVVVRIDGCHFHNYCKGLQKPFDPIFIKTMQQTTKSLCENIQGCKIGYVESDEISLLLTDYDTLQTDAWFNYSVQKICSVSASMAALFFNKYWQKNVAELSAVYKSKSELGAYFDARAFNLPKEEVTNYFIWRQNDATRNSIQSLAQANFSQKQIHSMNNSQLQDKLHEEKGINWNDCKTVEKRGSCVIHVFDKSINRSKWIIDEEIPIFTQNRDYIENILKKLEG